MYPLSSCRRLDNIGPLVARFATPPHLTPSPQPPPQGAVPHPTLPSLCAPPLSSSSPGQRRHPCCCNMQHPLMPREALWLLGVTLASCQPPPLINTLCGTSRHAGVPAALTVTSPFYRICDGPPTPPSSWPSSGTSSTLPRLPAQPDGLELQLWASATCLIVQTLQSRPWLVLTAP